MDLNQTFRMMGIVHLAQLGNPERAAQLIGDLADHRAKLLGLGEGRIEDIQSVAFKLCDWWPNKPQDWKTFMAALRPQLLVDPEGSARAVRIFTEDFLKLDLPQTVELFRDRLNFLAHV